MDPVISSRIDSSFIDAYYSDRHDASQPAWSDANFHPSNIQINISNESWDPTRETKALVAGCIPNPTPPKSKAEQPSVLSRDGVG